MLTIRPTTLDDVTALRKVIEATTLFPSEMLGEMLAGFLDNAADEIWVTADQGAPIAVGYSAPERMTEGTWNVLLIAVHPDHQRKGCGQAIMRNIEGKLLARHARVLLVETSGLPEFERTRSFYDKLGFEREARIRDYYRIGEDKIVFRKALDASDWSV